MTTIAPGPTRFAAPERLRRFAARVLPRRSDYAGLSRSWRGDLVAGVTVGVVALPLALGFGVTSGLGAAAGLVTAIVAGVVAAVFGGSSLQVSGPTGAMTVVLVPIVAAFGPAGVAAVAVIAGAMLVILGLSGLGRSVSLVPWPVIEGFSVGIATVIALQQLPAALGVSAPPGSSVVSSAVQAIRHGLGNPAGMAPSVGLTVLVVVVMAVLPRLHRGLPASLIAVVLAAVVAFVGHLPVAHVDALGATLSMPRLPHLDPGTIRNLLSSALAVAALAALESLLSARVADGMSDAPRTDSDRELVGQGLANVASGFFGGMPATGAIARTAVNARAGAQTRVGAITHAAVLVAVVSLAAPIVGHIPLAALAGVLLATAYRMVEPTAVAAVMRSTRSDALVMTATAVATIALDLVTAVEIGIAVAVVLTVRSVARASAPRRESLPGIEVGPDDEHAYLHDHIAVYRLDGAVFFGVAQKFLDELTTVGDVRVVILRLSSVNVLDATGAKAIGQIVDDLSHRGVTVLLKGAATDQLELMRRVGALEKLASQSHLFADLDAALRHARRHVARISH